MLNDFSGAVDWTNKRIKRVLDKIEFSWDSWSQKNKFTYPNPVKYLVPVTSTAFPRLSFDGFLSCLNEDIDLDKNVYESIFSPCQLNDQGYMGVVRYNIASVEKIIYGATQRVWNSEPTSYAPFDNDPLPMLLLLRDKDATENSIIYDATPRTDYKVAYFSRTAYEDIATNVLRWRGLGSEVGLLDRYYRTLGTLLAKGVKKVTRFYNLSELDIYQFDPLKLIFDQDDYYLVNKVFDYVAGYPTKVELLKATFTREREVVLADTGELVFEGFAPIVSAGAVATPGYGDILFSGFAPSVFVNIAYDIIAERNSAVSSATIS